MKKTLLLCFCAVLLLSGCGSVQEDAALSDVPEPTATPSPAPETTPEPYWPADAVEREQQYGKTVWTEGRIFFLWEGEIWCYDAAENLCRKICGADTANGSWQLSADGGRIWFYRDRVLCSVNTDGEDLREVQPADGVLYGPRAIGGKVFYFEGPALRRMSQETGNVETSVLLSSHIYVLEEAAGADKNWFYYAEMDASPDTRKETGTRQQTTIYRISLQGWDPAEEWLVLPGLADTNVSVFGRYVYYIRYLEPEPLEDSSPRVHNQLYRYDIERGEDALLADYAMGYWFAESGLVIRQEDAGGTEQLILSDPDGNTRELLQVEFEDGTWNVPLGIAGDRLLYAARDGSFRLMELSDPSQEIVFSLPEMAES